MFFAAGASKPSGTCPEGYDSIAQDLDGRGKEIYGGRRADFDFIVDWWIIKGQWPYRPAATWGNKIVSYNVIQLPLLRYLY